MLLVSRREGHLACKITKCLLLDTVLTRGKSTKVGLLNKSQERTRYSCFLIFITVVVAAKILVPY